MNSFRCRYEQVVPEYYYRPIIESTDGVPEYLVNDCEYRLGLRLPQVLREFYLMAGSMADVNNAYDRLASIDELSVDDSQEVLVIYHENQNVVLWGVPLGRITMSDPPVMQAVNQELLDW